MSQDFYTKKTEFGVLNSNEYPQKIKNGLIFSVIFFFAMVPLSIVMFFDLAKEYGLGTGAPFALVLALLCSIAGYIYIRKIKKLDEEYALFMCEVKSNREKKEKEIAYRKEHEDELFYQECKKAGIDSDNTAGVARMKLVAKQMGISCSEEELAKKYLKGRLAVKKRIKDFAEKEKQARIPVLRKEEQAAEKEYKKYMNLRGNEKRVQECMDLVVQARAKVARFSNSAEVIEKGGQAIYSTYAKKETDWAVHGGVASAIAGGAAGVAVAADIQRKNAEARAYNDNLSQAIGQFTADQQMNIWMAQKKAEESLQQLEQELEQAKLKLVDEKPQSLLLSLLGPKIVKTETSETGAITFTVSTRGASLTIYDSVKATVDGTFKVKIMDGDLLAGEAYFTLPYKGSFSSNELTSICASLPEEQKKYTFVFAPHNLFAIEL